MNSFPINLYTCEFCQWLNRIVLHLICRSCHKIGCFSHCSADITILRYQLSVNYWQLELGKFNFETVMEILSINFKLALLFPYKWLDNEIGLSFSAKHAIFPLNCVLVRVKINMNPKFLAFFFVALFAVAAHGANLSTFCIFHYSYHFTCCSNN